LEGIDDKELATPSKIGGVLVQPAQITPDQLSAALWLQEMGGKRVGEILTEQGAAPPDDVHAAQNSIESRNSEPPSRPFASA